MQARYEDKTLECRACGGLFVWTAGEQRFYANKGLEHPPARCPTCRANRQSPRQREYYAAICDRCGVQTQVPFLPHNDRPVYCSSCYDLMRAEQGHHRATLQ